MRRSKKNPYIVSYICTILYLTCVWRNLFWSLACMYTCTLLLTNPAADQAHSFYACRPARSRPCCLPWQMPNDCAQLQANARPGSQSVRSICDCNTHHCCPSILKKEPVKRKKSEAEYSTGSNQQRAMLVGLHNVG